MPTNLLEHAFSLKNKRGDRVDGDVRYTEDGRHKPVVVMCHGFKGFKDWGPFPSWGRRLAEKGFVSVLFNFSYNGVHRDQPTTFTELDAFADNTFTRELDDLEAVVDAVTEGMLEAPVDTDRIALMGHSRGGGTAILHTARDERISALVTWSAVAAFIERFSDEQIDDWASQGYTELRNARTGQTMRLNRVLYDDAQAHADELDVQAAARSVSVPWLIVHAPDDEAVSLEAAHQLQEAAPHADFFEAQGGHTFGGQHPFEGAPPTALVHVWDRTLRFFREHLLHE